MATQYRKQYDTPIGTVTVTATAKAITGLDFGAVEPETKETPLLAQAHTQLMQYFKGNRKQFYLPLAPEGTAFQQKVWQALLQIPYACTKSYGDIARAIGEPNASRAVGMANNKNPIPIFIPCHRVIGGNGSLTGYGGGLDIKEKLLELERSSCTFFPYTEKEMAALCQKDERMAEAVRRIGKLSFTMQPDVFTNICECIVGQQISMKSADTVWQRMLDRFGRIAPETIVMATEEEIQSCGMYMPKAVNIKHAAEAVLAGEVKLSKLNSMSDEAAAEELKKLPGVGDWTVEMILVFSLGRMDVMPYCDSIMRRGLCSLYGLEQLSKRQFKEYQKRFSPYGTLACFYLWIIGSSEEDLML